MDICAPKNKDNEFSCFSDKTINEMIRIWNSNNVLNKIEINDKSRKNLVEKLKKKLNCNEDECIIQKLKNSNTPTLLLEKALNDLKPKKPESWNIDKNEWASTSNIDDVLEQYEAAYTDFKYLGAVPIDFDKKLDDEICVVDELCKIDIESLWFKGIRRLGMVFNLDPHDKPGSHWVSLFVDFKSGGIYFCDSVGNAPVLEIKKLMKKIQTQCNDLLMKNNDMRNFLNKKHEITTRVTNQSNNNVEVNDIRYFNKGGIVYISDKQYKIIDIKDKMITLDKGIKTDISGKNISQLSFRNFYNNVKHQTDNSECGIYSIFFLVEMLKHGKFENFVNNLYPDKEIEKFREIFWRN